MIKKGKEMKKKEKNKYNVNTQTQLKVMKNLKKLDKKRKKIFANTTNSKSTLDLYNLNKTERQNIGLSMSKNIRMQKSTSKNNLTSRTKILKIQKKQKAKKLKSKVDSPSKILSSDSELEDMDPNDYLEY